MNEPSPGGVIPVGDQKREKNPVTAGPRMDKRQGNSKKNIANFKDRIQIQG
jgi:hypothetical protein